MCGQFVWSKRQKIAVECSQHADSFYSCRVFGHLIACSHRRHGQVGVVNKLYNKSHPGNRFPRHIDLQRVSHKTTPLIFYCIFAKLWTIFIKKNHHVQKYFINADFIGCGMDASSVTQLWLIDIVLPSRSRLRIIHRPTGLPVTFHTATVPTAITAPTALLQWF